MDPYHFNNTTTEAFTISTENNRTIVYLIDDLTKSTFYKIFRVYAQLMVVVCGLIGNNLAIVVLLGSKFKNLSTSPYLVCLAISDNLYLLTGVALVPLMTVMGYNDLYITTVHLSGCVIYLFVAYCSAQVSSWMITAVTMERVGVVAMPHKSKSLFTKRKSCLVIVVLIIVLMLENSHIFFAHQLVIINTDGDKACLIRDSFEYFSSNIWPWIDAIAYTFLPFGIILICNIVIISLVLKSVRQRQTMTSSSIPDAKQDNETNRMTQMLLVVSFFFILTTTPISMYLLFADPNDPDRISENSVGYITVNFIASLNHSCNFVMYSLSGPTFRDEIKRIFYCKAKSCDQHNNSSVEREGSTDVMA